MKLATPKALAKTPKRFGYNSGTVAQFKVGDAYAQVTKECVINILSAPSIRETNYYNGVIHFWTASPSGLPHRRGIQIPRHKTEAQAQEWANNFLDVDLIWATLTSTKGREYASVASAINTQDVVPAEKKRIVQ